MTPDDIAKPKCGVGVCLLFAVLFAAHAWLTIGSNLTGLHSNHIDALGQLPWMERWADPGVFPNDLMADYFQRHHLPPGARAIYYVLIERFGIDLNLACRIVAAFWYVATFVLFVAVVRLAEPEQSWAITLAAVAITLLPFHLTPVVRCSIFTGFLGGLARAAGSAVLLFVVYGLAKPNWRVVAWAIMLGAAFYPPVFVIAFTVAGLMLLVDGRTRLRENLAAVILGGGIAAVIVYLWYPLSIDPRFGPMVTRDDIAWAPEIVHLHFPHGTSLGQVMIGWLRDCWFAVVSLAMQAIVYRGDRLLRANAMMLLAGLILTAASAILWPRLYEIDRYMLWPRNVVTFIAVASVLSAGAAAVARVPLLRPARIALLAVVGYLAFNGALVQYRIMRAKPMEIDPVTFDRFQAKVVEFLHGTPKDTRLAALGEELDTIPTFARRSLLMIQTAICPYHRDFHREMVNRYLAVQDATYATDWSAIRKLRDDYKVQYLSVDRSKFDPAHFQKRAGNPVARTWLPERVEPIRKLGPDQSFLLKFPPREMIVVEEGDYVLLDLQRMP